jgi:hypothetical protein
MTQPTRKNQYSSLPAIEPVKRARAIRDALRTGKIKQSAIIDETLVLLDEIVASQERQTA